MIKRKKDDNYNNKNNQENIKEKNIEKIKNQKVEKKEETKNMDEKTKLLSNYNKNGE